MCRQLSLSSKTLAFGYKHKRLSLVRERIRARENSIDVAFLYLNFTNAAEFSDGHSSCS